MKKPAQLLAAFALLALARCAGGDDLAAVIPDGKVSVTSRDVAEAALLISAYRVQHGLTPVLPDSALDAAAAHQARAVARAGKLSHGAFESRMASFQIRGYSAENLSAGSDTVAGAIARWKSSHGHNENLLMPQARRIGIARADSPGQGYQHYWALVLAQ